MRRLPSFHAGISGGGGGSGRYSSAGSNVNSTRWLSAAIPSGCPGYSHHFSRTVTIAQTHTNNALAPRAAAQTCSFFTPAVPADYSLGAGASPGFFAPAADFPPIIGFGFQ